MKNNSTKKKSIQSTKPFLKWPGGKRWATKHISAIIKDSYNGCYYEPFLGGGAVFFNNLPDTAFLSDVNNDLINTYKMVRDYPDQIIERLKELPVSKEIYYEIRETIPDCEIDQAVRFLYLNRTAFGGMYRVNSKGEFNVPYGGGERKPDILWRKNLLKDASNGLKNKRIECLDFEEVIDSAKNGDLIYCDPTYTVAHSNNGFVKYNEKIFSWADQERLLNCAIRAYNKGVTVIISNAAHKSILELYSPFKPRVLSRMSLISRKIDSRKKVKEFLFVLKPH